MTLLARVTAPLAAADDAVNALSDTGNRLLSWTWWPLGPLRKHQTTDAAHLGVSIAWAFGSTFGYEAVVPKRLQSDGARAQVERVVSIVAGIALAIIAAGAWDRRAERLRRRPWRLLRGRS
jgi:hypothetical protein